MYIITNVYYHHSDWSIMAIDQSEWSGDLVLLHGGCLRSRLIEAVWCGRTAGHIVLFLTTSASLPFVFPTLDLLLLLQFFEAHCLREVLGH